MSVCLHICLPEHLSKRPLVASAASGWYSQGIYLMISTNHFLGNPAVFRYARQSW